MHVTFVEDLGLTCRLFIKIKQLLGKNIGPAAAGPARPVPVPMLTVVGVELLTMV